MVTALKPVTGSSQVASAGYDAASQTLSVMYANSAFRYDYKGVPPDVAEAFDKAESKGRFLGSQVKGRFEFDKVDTAAAEEA
jgi:hypothetical protein